MSIDVIERRRVVEERLRRARNLAQALDQATTDFASGSGISIDDLDPEGSLRTAVIALAGVAALRPGFDVLVALPDSPFALRLRHQADDVNIALVRVETTASDGPAISGLPEPRKLSDPNGSTESPGTPKTPGTPEIPEASEPATAEFEDATDFDVEGHVASDLAAMLWQDLGPPPP